MREDNTIFIMFCGCFAALFFIVMHFAQQKRLVELQTQIDELRIIVDQRVLPALILDKEHLMPR